MIGRCASLALRAVVVLLLVESKSLLRAQALPTAIASGGYISVGAAASDFRIPYGQQTNYGYTAFIDANLTRRYGLEGEGRALRYNNSEDTRSSTYLVGPRVSLVKKGLRPYAKVLFGRGTFRFPFGDANGTYFVIAPGAGLDISVFHGRAFFRAIDFEYQDWQDFTYGANHPYGISTGISIRVF